jgi:predicted GIY-YIG superfamily endonuclease
MLYFIYELVDPKTDTVAYVGLTNNPNARFQDHMTNFGTNMKKSDWVRQLRSEHLKPRMRILEIVDTKEAAVERERYWIRHYLSLGISLVNIEHAVQRQGVSLVNVEHAIQKQNAIEDVIRENRDSSWVPMRKAAKILGIRPSKLSRLAEKYKLKMRNNPIDERVRLVDLNELQTLFGSAPRLVKGEDGKSFWYEFKVE